MWALGFLLISSVFIFLLIFIFRTLPKNLRMTFLFVSIFVPTSSPFWYHLYPSYSEFKKLCGKDNRLKIVETVQVDIIHEDSSCYKGLTALKTNEYIGFVCDEVVYQRGINWNSEQCQHKCPVEGAIYPIQQACVKECLMDFSDHKDTLIHYSYDFEYKRNPIIEGRLIENERTLINEKFGVMAKAINYQFYQYGDNLAKILGLASGVAPSIRCSSDFRINIYDIFPSKQQT